MVKIVFDRADGIFMYFANTNINHFIILHVWEAGGGWQMT